MDGWQGSLSEKIWKKFTLDAKNNVKTPLGLVSLMVNIDNVETLERQNATKDFGMDL